MKRKITVEVIGYAPKLGHRPGVFLYQSALYFVSDNHPAEYPNVVLLSNLTQFLDPLEEDAPRSASSRTVTEVLNELKGLLG